ncbi:MAG: hypothetical protein ACYDHX_04070 [Methanothrix sp.]
MHLCSFRILRRLLTSDRIEARSWAGRSRLAFRSSRMTWRTGAEAARDHLVALIAVERDRRQVLGRGRSHARGAGVRKAAAQCDRCGSGTFRFYAGILFYSKSVLRKSSIFPTVKSRIANAPIIFFGVDRAMNRIMNITARIERDTRSTLRKGMRMCFVKP